ncbi:MAG: serine hydrolase domain-containing protein [Pirellulaceae bacterium]|nr:beta-lactamase family protein [Planctomycetales bacterium]
MMILAAILGIGRSSDAERLEEIDAAMQPFVNDHTVSGVVTLVGQEGSIVHLGSIGSADLATGRLMTGDSLFAIASMTKPMTATAMLMLQDEGKLSLDDTVAKYLPSFAEVKLRNGQRVSPITLRQLLTHTSGLVGAQLCEESLAATAEKLSQRPLGYVPGEKWEYSPGLNVCGRVIEIVSGQSYEDFMTTRIFRPLGMTDTTFHPTTKQRERAAVLYKYDQRTSDLTPTENWLNHGGADSVPNPSGGLFSTAEDVFRFYQMILNGGTHDGQQIVSKSAVKAMTTIQTGDLETGFTPGNGWGLGWCVIRQPQGVTAMLSPGSYGHGGAFGTQVWVDPVKQRVFVLMIQRDGLPNSDDSDLRRRFQQSAVDALEK